MPEYRHVLLNPIPTHVLPFGVLALIIALILRSRRAEIVSLVVVFLSALSVWPVVYYGNEAYNRVLSMSDDIGDEWLKIHMMRADEWAWTFYILAAVAFLALLVPWKWPKLAKPLTVIALILGLIECGVGAYIAYPAGKVRHTEFRSALPPAAEVQAANKHAEDEGM